MITHFGNILSIEPYMTLKEVCMRGAKPVLAFFGDQ